MKTINSFFACSLIILALLSCNDSQKATESKLPSDTLAVDVTETQKIIPVEIKGDSVNSQNLPVKNPK